MGFLTRDSHCGSMGFSSWLGWWWGSWVDVATVQVDMGGSGYGFVGVGGGGGILGVGGGGLLIGLWIVLIRELIFFFFFFSCWLLVFWLSLRLP